MDFNLILFILQHCIYCLNFVGCSAIIWVYFKTKKSSKGKYRHFILAGSICDLAFNIGMFLFGVRARLTENYGFLVSVGWLSCTPISLPLGVLNIACFMIVLIIILYNFMYRFAVHCTFKIFNPFLKPWLFYTICIIPCIIVPQAIISIGYCFGPNHKIDIINAYFKEKGLPYCPYPTYILPSFDVSTYCAQVITSETIVATALSGMVACFCSFFITMELYVWRKVVSSATRKLQIQLFFLLFCQVVCFGIFFCLPIAIAAGALLIGFSYPDDFGYFLLVLTCIFATTNYCLTFLLIPEYRRQLTGGKKLFAKRLVVVSSVSSHYKN